jgi:hypothetical protein
VADEKPAAGHPSIWLVHQDRLYVFQSEANRTLFATDPDKAIARAERAWPTVRDRLVP